MTIYLHHYPASLFSEKVRLLLGYHGLDWQSVIIPNVMPRPLLMPLSGGYRKTPVLQIDANVYCDTQIIGRALARHTGDDSLYRLPFVADRVAEWADSQLFRVAVALNFRPEAVAAFMADWSEAEVARFQADRAELAKGAPIVAFSANAAENYLRQYLHALEAGLDGAYLFGDAPTIADFSVYHCLWFLDAVPLNRRYLEPFGAVRAWLERMAAFGHGRPQESSGEAALAAGRAATPVIPDVESSPPAGLSLGQEVAVTPVDYGLVPVTGELVLYSANEIAVRRQDPEAGEIVTHFPTGGFEVRAL